VSRADDRAAAFLSVVTWLRVALTPVVMALLLHGGHTADTAAAWLFGFAAVTDFVDGRLARRWKQTTSLGAFLDTTADKILVTGVLLALVYVGYASTWVAFLIIGREMLVLALKGVASAAQGEAVPPTILGKAKANVQFIAILIAIVQPAITLGPFTLSQWALWIATVVTVWSGADYVVRYGGLVSRPRQRPR
jgi:CDP-diacylglycerol---glycerol-3-phosphate 3-phosphatidyltransferase